MRYLSYAMMASRVGTIIDNMPTSDCYDTHGLHTMPSRLRICGFESIYRYEGPSLLDFIVGICALPVEYSTYCALSMSHWIATSRALLALLQLVSMLAKCLISRLKRLQKIYHLDNPHVK